MVDDGRHSGARIMKGQDILILLKLAVLEPSPDRPLAVHEQGASYAGGHPPTSMRGLEAALGVSKSEISKSLNRSRFSGLLLRKLSGDGEWVNRPALVDFLIHGLKYVFPVRPGPVVRGMPTAVDAPVFEHVLSRASGLALVWPESNASQQGEAIEPIYPSVPFAAHQDPALYDLLAIADSLRLGKARERKMAAELLRQRLNRSPCAANRALA